MTGALAAEWLKLRSVRSTLWVLAVGMVAVLLALAIDLYGTTVWDRLLPASRPGFPTMVTQAVTLTVMQMAGAVLGVLGVTSEFSTGQVRSSVVALPRRGLLVTAKALVLGVSTLVTATAALLVASLGGRAIIGDRVVAQPPLPREIALIVASGAVVMAFALLAMGLGLLMRSAAGSLVTVAMLWYPLQIIALHLPAPWNERISSVLLGSLGPEIAGYHISGPPQGGLSQVGAVAVLAAYALVPMVAAAVTFIRRDVR